MDDLVAWYRTQLDDDEQRAQAHRQTNWLSPLRRRSVLLPNFDEPGSPGSPDRVLREVDSKRKILDEYARLCEFGRLDGDGRRPSDPALHLAWAAFGKVVKLLAAAVDDRPGYRNEWRP